jgi:hypothetical protein
LFLQLWPVSLKRLVDELRIIQAHDEAGELLDSPQKRMKCGGKIFYRLSLKRPQQPTPEVSSGAEKTSNFSPPPKNLRAKNFRATKETGFTKDKSFGQASLIQEFKKYVDKPVDKPTLPTRYFFGKFSQLTWGIRHTRPIFVKFKDGNLLKHALGHLTEFQLELELVWFLQNKPEMKPTIGAALCKEVIEDFIQASFKEYGFYNALERTALQYSRREPEEVRGAAAAAATLPTASFSKVGTGVIAPCLAVASAFCCTTGWAAASGGSGWPNSSTTMWDWAPSNRP